MIKLGTDFFLEDPQEEENRRWAVDDNDKGKIKDKALENKKRFFEKNIKMEDVLPDGEEREEKVPNRFGYFETKEGTVMVGYDKYRRNGLMGFSLLSDDETEEENLPENDPYDRNTYFGKNYPGDEKYFESSALSFTYDPKTDSIQKSIDDDNNNSNDSKELLYQTEKEKKNTEKLKDEKDDLPTDQRDGLEKTISITEKIQNIKEEKNRDFLEEIKDFIQHFQNDKLNRIIDSEDAISRRKRIVEMSMWIIERQMIRKMLEDIDVEHLSTEEIYRLIKEKIKGMSKVDIIRIIDGLKNQ